MKVMGSKKATITAGGVAIIPMIVGIFTVVMQSAGMDPDLIASVQEVLIWALTIIVGTYNVGQGLADFGKEADKVTRPVVNQSYRELVPPDMDLEAGG